MLPPTTTLEAKSQALESRWCAWNGDWDSFVQDRLEAGDLEEIRIIETWPREFLSNAIIKGNRIDQWGENRLLGWLDEIHKLTTCEKYSKEAGHMVPDNGNRLSAAKFLVEMVQGRAPETPKVGKQIEEFSEKLKQREALKKQLENRGFTLTETVRTVEVDAAAST